MLCVQVMVLFAPRVRISPLEGVNTATYGVGVGVEDGIVVGLGVGVLVGLGVGVLVGLRVGVGVLVGLSVGLGVGVLVGLGVAVGGASCTKNSPPIPWAMVLSPAPRRTTHIVSLSVDFTSKSEGTVQEYELVPLVVAA